MKYWNYVSAAWLSSGTYVGPPGVDVRGPASGQTLLCEGGGEEQQPQAHEHCGLDRTFGDAANEGVATAISLLEWAA